MEIAITLFVVWAVVTVIGHGSWVILRGVFRLLTGGKDPVGRPSVPDLKSDLHGARRVIGRLQARGLLDSSDADEIRQKFEKLNDPWTTAADAAPPAETTVAAKSVRPAKSPQTPAPDDQQRSPDAKPAVHRDSPAEMATPSGPTTQEAPIVAELVPVSAPGPQADDARATGSRPPSAQVPATHVPMATGAPSERVAAPAPLLSKAEVIQSFLAAHNIRWGELVAGILIVVCSIGLVISLWSPLVDTHRVIPSLIFLGANAAIYAAGLYTLSRWRLRHTSRAVLVIATLLVPLSVLAGLAAAGTSADSVQLNDPITLAGILVAGAVYLWLLYLGGKAVTHRCYSGPIMMSVAGPVAMLPLLPASVRTWQAGAGWVVGIGSLAVFLSSIMMTHSRKRTLGSMGIAAGRARLLVMAFGGFSLAVAIGYAVFAVRGFGSSGILPIAVATVPALVALASVARSIMKSAKSGTQSLTGAAVCVIMIGLAWTVLPASMSQMHWVWCWAISFSASAAIVGWFSRQPRWLALSTLPLGMATTFSSPVWLSDQVWGNLALWQRIVGGEPMIASGLVAIVVGVAGRWVPGKDRRTWMGYAALFWASTSTTIAASLALSSHDALGIAPWWLVTCVLVAGAATACVMSRRDVRWSWAMVVAVAFVWMSVFQPLVWGELGSSAEWMATTLAIAASLLVIRELVVRWNDEASEDKSVARKSECNWNRASQVFAVLASVIACLMVSDDWRLSAATLGSASVLLFWSSTVSKSIETLRMSQLATAAMAVVFAYGPLRPWLWTESAWMAGVAIWGWSALAGATSGFWLAIRSVVASGRGPVSTDPVQRRLRFVVGNDASPNVMPAGWLGVVSIGLVAAGAAWAFTALLARAGQSDLIVHDAGFLPPILALSICSLVAWLMWKSIGQQRVETLLVTLVVAAVVWVSSAIVSAIGLGSAATLVTATTMAAGCCYLLGGIAIRHHSLRNGATQIFVSATVLAVLASAVLLWIDWLDPIMAGSSASVFSTLSVASWWIVGSIASLWMAWRAKNASFASISAVLAPSAAALVVPAYSQSHPIAWIQVAAITTVVWIVINRFISNAARPPFIEMARRGAMLFALVAGTASAMLVTVGIVFDLRALDFVFGPASFLSSITAITLWASGWEVLPLQRDSDHQRVPWPFGVTLLAGQFGWLAYVTGLVSGIQTVELVVLLWTLAAIASLIRYRTVPSFIDFAHVGLVTVAATGVAFNAGMRSEVMPWLALTMLTVGGLQTVLVGIGGAEERSRLVASRLLGWFVVCFGGWILVSPLAAGVNFNVQWSLLVLWASTWVVLWRFACPDQKIKRNEAWPSSLAIADMEFANVVMFAVIAEAILFTLSGRHSFQTNAVLDPWMWSRVFAYVAVGVASIGRAERRLVWSSSIATLTAAVSLAAVQFAIQMEATGTQRFATASISAGLTIAFGSHWLPAIANQLGRWAGVSPLRILQDLIQGTWQVAMLVVTLSGLSVLVMIVGNAPAADINLTIVSVAMAAWAIAEMAEACNGARLRHTAVAVALCAVGLWATVDSGQTSHPILTASMRWLVASVVAIPMCLFLFPKLLGTTLAQRWRDALHGGVRIAGVAAVCSLLAMLVMEAAVRSPKGISGIPMAMVIGVAITLGILSAIAGLVAILSGPGSSWRDRIALTDQQRTILIVAAQVIGAITWLHIFLCKTGWAFVGLRAYWPYTVMALAFVSVGAAEWARRRRDEVMSQTLSQTALYLPLVPVIGFWVSGSIDQLGWVFPGGKVRYDWILAMGTAYYIGISAMWKRMMPRVTAVVLGNAAWWVVLIQYPGWSFIAHPQAWLIPPAVCVLVVTHLYRDRLKPNVASSIRYASTLVIYVSSTADMLLQQIGTNLWGPVVLILLALLGMAAGVVLRVRPFLYLGALFVFLGATSMVWHAHLAIDAVWPWWVFGITTGICLLAGLMALEKNKPKLREYANQLATWQG